MTQLQIERTPWTCPDCGGDLINGQGLRACLDPECRWTERR